MAEVHIERVAPTDLAQVIQLFTEQVYPRQHDDLVFIDVEGNVEGKRDDIESHASGAVVQTAVEFVEEPVMQLHGESAIVAVKAHVQVRLQGKPLEAFCRYLRVWLFQDERWQIISGTVRIIS